MGFGHPRLTQAKRCCVLLGSGVMRPLKQHPRLPPQRPRCGKVLRGHGLCLGDEGVAGLEEGGRGFAGHVCLKKEDLAKDCLAFFWGVWTH